MAHFAQLNNDNIVQQVIVVSNDIAIDESAGKSFIASLGLTGEWVQTSYNNRIRRQYAGIGFTYDAIKDQFVQPQPFPSWTLDSNNDWQAPTAKPNDGKMYSWNEESLAWVEVVG